MVNMDVCVWGVVCQHGSPGSSAEGVVQAGMCVWALACVVPARQQLLASATVGLARGGECRTGPA